MKFKSLVLFVFFTINCLAEGSLEKNRQLCKTANAHNCYKVGLSYEFGKNGAKKDRDRASYYYKIACHYGSAEGCFSSGVIRSKEKRKEHRTGAKYKFASSCAYGYEKGCNKIGIQYHNKVQIRPNNIDKLIEFYKVGCRNGSNKSCEYNKYFQDSKDYGLL